MLSLETLAMVVQPHRVKTPLVNLRLNAEEEPQTDCLADTKRSMEEKRPEKCMLMEWGSNLVEGEESLAS